MADCSYARCKQERAAIKRELSKWSKDMVHIAALETIAEELMGHRKWKQHQDNLMRSHLLLKFTNQSEVSNQSKEVNSTNLEEVIIAGSPKESIASKVKTEITDNGERETSVIVKKEVKESVTEILTNNGTSQEDTKTVNVKAEVEIKDDPVINSIDWKPEDKCNFCIDGKLLTVNAKGDLVPESDPAFAVADLAKRSHSDSDSDYSNSTTDTGFNPNSQPLTSLPPNMTSFDPSLAVRLAAQIYPNLMLQTLAQQMNSSTPTSDTSAMSPSLKDSPSPSDQQASAEQPLDLSSKTSPNLPNSVERNKLKPRLTPITNRRQYTEDELHNALNDIMSGRLGTRRAAVIYKIPRSTLRNKVYKMSVEARRGASAQSTCVDEFVDPDEGEDDKDSVDDDYTASQIQSMNHTSVLKAATVTGGHTQLDQKLPNSPSTSTTPQSQLSQTPPIGAPTNQVDLGLMLQSIFLASGVSMDLTSPKIIEIYNNLLKTKHLAGDSGQRTPTPSAIPTSSQTDIMNNGGNKQQQPPQFSLDPRIVQHLQNNRLLNSDTPETAVTPTSSVDTNDDDPSILKIPSYKPGAVSSSLTNKNGGNESLISPIPKIPNSILQAAVTQQLSAAGISPPLGRHTNDSQSPPMINLREVMANNINRNFNPQNLLNKMTSSAPQQIAPDLNDAYNKRPSISVIKNFGGTDLRDFASAPNLIMNSSHHHNNSHHHQNMLNNAAGGKGTRPKRGKYRNYDRDSLVEAVKAVQRGEMSVHRAGSYYGVPHSTLEYKVKERHLMRPRKREPKQPIEERTGLNSNSTSNSGNSCNPANTNSSPSSSTPASSINSKSNSNIPGLTAVNNLDKLKSPLNIQQNKQQSGKSNPPFPNTSTNGLNMNLFDAQTNQIPFNYWTSGPYPGISPLDFPGRSDNMIPMKKFHDDRNRPKPNSMPSSSISNKIDSLYDAGENGSFLDGIIRKAIDRTSSANLLELARPKNLDLSNSSNKRSGSPSAYPLIDIKRERSGTPKSDDLPSTTKGSAPSSTITTILGDQLNGGSAAPTSILQEKLGKIKSETEDSL